jgi:DNA-binding GntR family transcriptional regulator
MPEATKPLRDVVADDLRQQIITGALRPGQRVREDDVAAIHGVSRVPAREAVLRLANEGYLELAPFRGAVVASPSPRRTRDAMQVRRALESMAARLAADHRGGPASTELIRLVQRGNRAVAAGNHAALPDLTNQFHDLVARASGNDDLADLLGQVREKVAWMFSVDLHGRSEGSWADHAAILQAVLDGDSEAAASRMDIHVRKDEQLFAERLQAH